MNLGEQIKTRRSELNMSQEELAGKLSVTRSAVSNWETGKNYPDLQTIVDISAELNISLDILLKGDRKVVEKITKDTNENLILRSKVKILIGVIVVLCIAGVIALCTFNYLYKQSYIPYKDLGMSVTTNGNVYVEKPFYRSNMILVGPKNEIVLIYFTKSNAEDKATKARVGNFNMYDEELQAAYYLPEKYVKKYNLLNDEHSSFDPSESELNDIMNVKNLVWEHK